MAIHPSRKKIRGHSSPLSSSLGSVSVYLRRISGTEPRVISDRRVLVGSTHHPPVFLSTPFNMVYGWNRLIYLPGYQPIPLSLQSQERSVSLY